MDNKELLERFVELAPTEWKVTLFEVAKPNAVFHNIRNDADDGVLYLDLSHDRASAEAAFFLWDYLIGLGINPRLNPDRGFWSCWIERPLWQFKAQNTRIEALVRACVTYWESTGNQEGVELQFGSSGAGYNAGVGRKA